jgi:hypothetical protein
MSAVLARLLREPNGGLAAKGFTDFLNYGATNLMTEEAIVKRAASTRNRSVSEADAIAAIRKGIAAAKGNHR